MKMLQPLVPRARRRYRRCLWRRSGRCGDDPAPGWRIVCPDGSIHRRLPVRLRVPRRGAFGSTGAPAASAQGPVATTNGGVSRASSPSQVCWTVSARYGDGTSQTKSGCSTLSAIAGAGAG